MYDGKAIIIANLVQACNLDMSMLTEDCEKTFHDNPHLLNEVPLKKVYDNILRMKDEFLSKALCFLIINYYKMNPEDYEFYASFCDGDIQKIYDLVVKNRVIFYDLLKCFFAYIKKGEYPKAEDDKAMHNIINLELTYHTAKITFADEVIIDELSRLFLRIERPNSFSIAAEIITLGIFYNHMVSTTNDISEEISFLRTYAGYLYKMMHAEVYALYSIGILKLDIDFEECFLTKVENGEYFLAEPPYNIALMKYYMLARRLNHAKLPPDITQKVKDIDPLYREGR